LHFARWLEQATGRPGGVEFVPVHVLDDEHLRTVLRFHRLDDVVAAERSDVARQIGEVMARGEAPDPDLVQAITVDRGLEAERARLGATGVIVARAAPSAGRHVVRLGVVARRLLRRLASPVLVVPPDLAPSSIGDGPVVVLSSLDAGSAEACRLARSLADGMHRELSVVHVDEERSSGPAPRGAPAPHGASAGPFGSREHSLAEWVARHGLWPDVATVVAGELPGAAVAYAEARHAPLVVVGAHRSSGVRGALESKLWRWLAAHSRQPVLVVPTAPLVLDARHESRERA
jgi:nucleotide-binding universal stress UspA family protein